MSSVPELIDSHAHVYGGRFGEDLDEVLARAADAGVSTVILPATKPSEFGTVREVAERSDQVRIALGVHPHHAADVTDEEVDRIPEEIGEAGGVAVGEIGLDYHYDFAPRERQKEVFRRQIAIARELDLPIIVHNRESDEDVLTILGEEQDGQLRFQLHCFSSDVDVLNRALDLGGVVSFTGNITFRKSTLDDVVRNVPDGRFMIETDSPYMTPVPNRGKRNEPAFVREVAEKIALLRQDSFERIADMTTTTARKFFRLAATLILVALTVGGTLSAQDDTEPVAAVDTTERTEPYDKLFGVGVHIDQATFLVERITSASTAAFGYRFSATPLLPLGVDWFGIDAILSPITIDAFPDSVTGSIIDSVFTEPREFTNTHNRFDLLARFHFKPKAIVDFTGLIGYSYFYNRYGVDEVVIEEIGDTITIGTEYEETLHGIGLGLGILINLETEYGTFVPGGSWTFSTHLGDRPLARLGETFQISHVRLSLTYFPPFRSWLGLDYGD